MAIPAGELEARGTFDLELDEEMAFLEAQPSTLLAAVQKLTKPSFGGDRSIGSHRIGRRYETTF
jgi:hypothetical protein